MIFQQNTKIDDLLFQVQEQENGYLYFLNKKYINKINIDSFDKNSIFFYRKKYRFQKLIYYFRDLKGNKYKFYSGEFVKTFYPELIENSVSYLIEFPNKKKHFIDKNMYDFTIDMVELN